MKRSELRSAVSARLDGRGLVWFGTRGEDVEAVADLHELSAAFSIVARYHRRSSVEACALEDLTGVRVDLDVHDIDAELRAEAMAQFRHRLLGVLAHPSAVFTYRPSTFISALSFARRDRCLYVGLFKDHQAAFEHKPWVETAVGDLGIPRIPWTYVADEEQLETLRFLDAGPVMLRRSRSNGGAGLVRVDEREQLAVEWPREEEAYVSVAPFIADGLPVNVSAVAWRNGTTVHQASVQLIGVPELTARPFGYCGNDFGAAADLAPEQLDAIEDTVKQLGAWLRRYGYLGAFGVDFLVTSDGVPLFMEINPRFQGSTHASCQLSAAAGESCLLLEHLGALLGLGAPRSVPLRQQACRTEPFAHFVVHSPHATDAHVDVSELVRKLTAMSTSVRADVLVSPTTRTQPHATIARMTVRDRITTRGSELADPWREIVARWRHAQGESADGRSCPTGDDAPLRADSFQSAV